MKHLPVPGLSLYISIRLALTPDALLLSKSKTGDITPFKNMKQEQQPKRATLNMSGGVIKQRTATNQGCVSVLLSTLQ